MPCPPLPKLLHHILHDKMLPYHYPKLVVAFGKTVSCFVPLHEIDWSDLASLLHEHLWCTAWRHPEVTMMLVIRNILALQWYKKTAVNQWFLQKLGSSESWTEVDNIISMVYSRQLMLALLVKISVGIQKYISRVHSICTKYISQEFVKAKIVNNSECEFLEVTMDAAVAEAEKHSTLTRMCKLYWKLHKNSGNLSLMQQNYTFLRSHLDANDSYILKRPSVGLFEVQLKLVVAAVLLTKEQITLLHRKALHFWVEQAFENKLQHWNIYPSEYCLQIWVFAVDDVDFAKDTSDE